MTPSPDDEYPNDELRETQDDDAGLEALLGEIRQQYGESIKAILVYGSWLRGKRDTMLDFYVLLDDYRSLDSAWQGWMCRLLPPNVYQIHHGDLRAKYALLTLDRFCHAMQDDFHSYFWARFAQPCEILFTRDDATGIALESAFQTAAATFVRRVVPTLPDRFSSQELWTSGLSQTYRCELRTESSNRADSLYNFNPDWYDRLTLSLAQTTAGPATTLSTTTEDNIYSNQCSIITRKLSSISWWLRRVQGKLLSMARLVKAALTFNDPLQYLLWKIERHSGIYIEPTSRQLKYPLIFAWPLLWKLHRRGAFR